MDESCGLPVTDMVCVTVRMPLAVDDADAEDVLGDVTENDALAEAECAGSVSDRVGVTSSVADGDAVRDADSEGVEVGW